jgi:hypothetical protein
MDINSNYFSDMEYHNILTACRLLSEISQFNSEILQVSAQKNIIEEIEINISELYDGYIYQNYFRTKNKNKVHSIIDNGDHYRLNYFTRKNLNPTNLYWVAREGLVEDSFCSWTPDNEDSDSKNFDPDQNWGLLLL